MIQTEPTGSTTPTAPFDFSGARVVIAGGTSGVGLETALAFGRAGARHILLLGRDGRRGERAVETVAAACPDAVPGFASADVNDPSGAETAAAAAAERFGGIDVLVTSTAAPYQPTLLHDTNLAQVRAGLVEQALGPMLMSRAVLPHMRRQGAGSIINIASDAAKVPTPGECVIGAAMAAIVTFSQTLALEAKRDGIRVNVLTPSLIVNTGSYDRAMDEPFSKKIFERITSQAHLGLTEPQDIANAILFLASPLARRITGQVISVNGGISIA
ncbi:MAG: 3-oxoacyl-[acyl-carrier-protein] reductase FabG [Blastococcus sp.]|nr:3-oxoacyl-[acyl-carrier-protein] reductase FabG [Blastococcus sp.]